MPAFPSGSRAFLFAPTLAAVFVWLFAEQLKALLEREDDPVAKTAVIQRVVEKVFLTKKRIEIHFHVGKMHYKRELEATTSGSRLFLCPEFLKNRMCRSCGHSRVRWRNTDKAKKSPARKNVGSGSNSLTNGGGCPSKVEPNRALCVSLVRGASWTRDTTRQSELARIRRAEGLKIEEITAQMGISRSTVKRSSRKLREARQSS